MAGVPHHMRARWVDVEPTVNEQKCCLRGRGRADGCGSVNCIFHVGAAREEKFDNFDLVPPYSGEEWGIPTYHELALVTSEEYLKNNKGIVEDFVNAFSKGYELSIENNDASMESLISAFPEVNVELETKGIKLLSPLWQESFDSDGMDSWIKFGDWMKDKELIDRDLDVLTLHTKLMTEMLFRSILLVSKV